MTKVTSFLQSHSQRREMARIVTTRRSTFSPIAVSFEGAHTLLSSCPAMILPRSQSSAKRSDAA
jgi:hypothetical protein